MGPSLPSSHTFFLDLVPSVLWTQDRITDTVRGRNTELKKWTFHSVKGRRIDIVLVRSVGSLLHVDNRGVGSVPHVDNRGGMSTSWTPKPSILLHKFRCTGYLLPRSRSPPFLVCSVKKDP